MTTPSENLYGPPGAEIEVPKKAGPTLMDQILGVLTEPSTLFDKLQASPAWVGPYLLLGTLSAVFSLLWVFRLDWLAFLAEQAEKAGKPAPPIPESALPVIRFVGTLQCLFISFGILLIFGLILWGLAKWLSDERGKVRFAHAMAALTAPSLVKLPAILLGTIVTATRQLDTQTPDKLIPTSLGFYVHPENIKVQTALYHLDPFALAYGVLGYLALRKILKLPAGPAIGLVVVYNCLVTLLPILLAK